MSHRLIHRLIHTKQFRNIHLKKSSFHRDSNYKFNNFIAQKHLVFLFFQWKLLPIHQCWQWKRKRSASIVPLHPFLQSCSPPSRQTSAGVWIKWPSGKWKKISIVWFFLFKCAQMSAALRLTLKPKECFWNTCSYRHFLYSK